MLRICGVLVLFVAAAAAPSCIIDPSAFPDGATGAPDGWLQFRFVEGDTTLVVETTGDLRFDDASSRVLPASEDAVFRLEETSLDSARKLELTAAGNDTRYRYWVSGREAEFDAAAGEWLAEVLPHLLRETALLAEARTTRLLREGGVDRVLEEIALIRSSESRRVYAEELIAQGTLTTPEAKRLIQEVRQIESGSRLKDALAAIAPSVPEGQEVTIELVAGCQQIGSSSSRRLCLQEVADAREVHGPVAVALTRAAAGIRSSSEKALILISLIDRSPRLAEVDLALMEALQTVRSSTERSRAIKALIEAGPRPESLTRLATLVTEIPSSADRTSTLQRFSRLLPNDNTELLAVYLDGVRRLPSMAAKERTLQPLLRRDDLSGEIRQQIRRFVERELPDGVLRRRLLTKLSGPN